MQRRVPLRRAALLRQPPTQRLPVYPLGLPRGSRVSDPRLLDLPAAALGWFDVEPMRAGVGDDVRPLDELLELLDRAIQRFAGANFIQHSATIRFRERR